MQSKNVTYDDIAKRTNFSKTTISRYFNNRDSLTLKNQAIIAQALIDLDYHKNKLAKILANGKSEFVGIIIPNMFMHYYSEILNQILTTYETYDYKFLVFIGDDDVEKEKRYIEELLSYQIEGLIILSHTTPSKDLAKYNIPIVTIEREDEYINSVNTDNFGGAVQATELLIENECDVLVHINNNVPEYTPSYRRIEGFEETCKKKGVPYEIYYSDFGDTYEDIQLELQETLEDLDQKYPDKKIGLFLSNDTYANIMLNLIFRKYGNLPDRFKIIGFDDSPIASQAIIPITTVAQQIDEIAVQAMELLVNLMNEQKKRVPNPPKGTIHKNINPKLIIRDTVQSTSRDGAADEGEESSQID